MIEAQELSFRYPRSSTDVIKGISLRIPEGSFVSIMGTNGSGKSTLARCLNGLLNPSGGSVRVDGLETGDRRVAPRICKKVGLVFQEPHLQMTSLTIERELAFGLENMRLRSEEMHSLVDQFLDEFGFRDRKDEPPSTLSGGEMQRLALASVMILRPSYLILDEATSLLSVRTRESILRKVTELRERLKICVVLITQFPSEAMLSERLIVLQGGTIVFDDEPEKVFRKAEVLAGMGVPIPMRERLRFAV
jgi:energy-coupling factor transport system ATP-binding protein